MAPALHGRALLALFLQFGEPLAVQPLELGIVEEILQRDGRCGARLALGELLLFPELFREIFCSGHECLAVGDRLHLAVVLCRIHAAAGGLAIWATGF